MFSWSQSRLKKPHGGVSLIGSPCNHCTGKSVAVLTKRCPLVFEEFNLAHLSLDSKIKTRSGLKMSFFFSFSFSSLNWNCRTSSKTCTSALQFTKYGAPLIPAQGNTFLIAMTDVILILYTYIILYVD